MASYNKTGYSQAVADEINLSYKNKSRDEIFSKKANKNMNPANVIRESRESDISPDPLSIIIALDETGSMLQIPHQLVTNQNNLKGKDRFDLGIIFDVLTEKGIINPQILTCGVGDHYSDSHYLQVGQFETDADKLIHWLTNIYLEGNGGGNNGESYALAWLFAARQTRLDSFEKYNKKGILFTIGDERIHEKYEADMQKDLFGYSEATDMTAKEILSEVQLMYDVFHINITHGVGVQSGLMDQWSDLLGNNFISIEDYKLTAHTIATIVAMKAGATLTEITDKYNSQIGNPIKTALVNVSFDITKPGESGVINVN